MDKNIDKLSLIENLLKNYLIKIFLLLKQEHYKPYIFSIFTKFNKREFITVNTKIMIVIIKIIY